MKMVEIEGMIEAGTTADDGKQASFPGFDAMLLDAQPRLRGYLASILGGWVDVDDLLQETNLVLVKKQEDFKSGTNFIAWAFRVAYFKATTWRRDRSREGRVILSDHGFQELALVAEEYFSTLPPRMGALRQCLAELPAGDQELVRRNYFDKEPLTAIASGWRVASNTLHKRMSRIRLVLRACLERRERRESSPGIQP